MRPGAWPCGSGYPRPRDACSTSAPAVAPRSPVSAGPEFGAALGAAGFTRLEARAFLFGAARLWVAQSASAIGQNPTAPPAPGRNARERSGDFAHGERAVAGSFREASAWRLARAMK